MTRKEDFQTQELIIGASSLIAQAYINNRLQSDNTKIIAISRTDAPEQFHLSIHEGALTWITSNYEPEHIQNVCAELAQTIPSLSRVIVCNGTLHNDHIKPEKQLKQLKTDHFQHVMQVNTLTPMLWLQGLQPYFTSHQNATLTLFSARVGSIEDNQLGGWYSYRASKAALNMMAKSFSVELSRRCPNIGILLFHPGTTDTPLSKPFQTNVPAGKLFEPDFVAQQLADILCDSETLRPISYLDWQGKTIAW